MKKGDLVFKADNKPFAVINSDPSTPEAIFIATVHNVGVLTVDLIAPKFGWKLYQFPIKNLKTVAEVREKAQAAFWKVVTDECQTKETEDFGQSFSFDTECDIAVKGWIEANSHVFDRLIRY